MSWQTAVRSSEGRSSIAYTAARSTISRNYGLKELRPRVPGTAQVRLLFAFDPDREAIVLVAGDKAGRWIAWYAEAIPLAEKRYAAYRREANEEEQ
jgi:hypothetical protein